MSIEFCGTQSQRYSKENKVLQTSETNIENTSTVSQYQSLY